MQAVIAKQNVGKWAKDFVQELFEVRDKNLRLQAKIIKDFRSNPVKQAYRWAKKRLLILDYDGTLSAFFSDPAAASPTPEVLQLLRNLSSDPLNKVVICSGRDRQTLDEWFGDLPIGLSAEHGTFYKTDGEWHSKAHNDEWDSEIMEIMQRTQEKTPHSKLESKGDCARLALSRRRRMVGGDACQSVDQRLGASLHAFELANHERQQDCRGEA